MSEACGCCETPSGLTPVSVDNRPGLSAVAYRVGSFTSFRETMLRSIASASELSGLTTRASDDHAIAVLRSF